MAITVRPLAYALGAEITGIDASRFLDDQTVKEIKDLWHQHQVLVFPRQDIDMAQHVAFSKQFGELELHPMMHITRIGEFAT